MNPKISAGFVVAASLFLLLSLSENGNARRKEISSTRRVVIDRRSFASGESSADGGSLLKKELERLGVRLPGGFTLPKETHTSHPAFEGRLRESGPRVPEAPRLPPGFIEEHTLRMEGNGAPVELVFGKIGSPGGSVRSRLLSSGWESMSSEKGPGGMRVLQFLHGKETVIACLDEAEGTFLLFREVGR